MMELMPPEPGEPDHPVLSPQSSTDEEDVQMKEPGGLKSTPGVGSAGKVHTQSELPQTAPLPLPVSLKV